MLGSKCDPIDLSCERYNYHIWIENKKLANTTSRNSDKEESVDLSEMPPLERITGVKEGQVIKLLTLNKLLTRLSILDLQIKAGNNSYKLKKKK